MHWPILTFLRLGSPNEPSPWIMGFGLLLSMGLSALTLRFVERRFRRRPADGLPRRRLFATTFAGIVLLALSGSALQTDQGLRGRARGEAVEAMAAEHDLSPLWKACHDNKHPTAQDCAFGAARPGSPDVLLWGDSMAASWAPAVADWAAAQGLRGQLATQGACLPSLGVDIHERDGALTPCRAHNAALVDLVHASPRLKMVVLVARWTMYEQGSGPVEGVWYYLSGPDGRRDPAAFHQLFASGLDHLVDTLERQGPPGLKIVILGPSPEFSVNPDRCAERAVFVGRDPEACLSTPFGAVVARQAGVRTALRDIAARHPKVVLLATDPLFCDDFACHARVQDRIGFIDGDHLTQAAARGLGPRLFSGLDSRP